MNTLTIPITTDLKSLEEDVIASSLSSAGAEGNIDIAPWSSYPYRPQASFKAMSTSSYLFLRFNVEGKGLKAEFLQTNDPVWQDSCVEFFVEDAAGDGYFNFEINCIGTLLCAHQKSKGVETVHISEDDARRVLRFASVKGQQFPEKEDNHNWSVTIGIPWDLLGYGSVPDRIRANFYKCADGSRWPHYLCWSPISTPQPDFHRPEFFGTLLFVKES